MFFRIKYKLSPKNMAAQIKRAMVDVIMKLNSNPILIPPKLPKLTRDNIIGLRCSALRLDIFISFSFYYYFHLYFYLLIPSQNINLYKKI